MTVVYYRGWDGCSNNPGWILCRCLLSEQSSQRLNKCFPAVPGPASHCTVRTHRAPAFPDLLYLAIAVGTAIATTQLEGSLQLHQLGFRGWDGVSSGDTGEGGTKQDVRPSATGWRVGWNRALAG